MNSNSIALVISSKIALHTAIPYIEELKKHSISIEYICSSDAIDDIVSFKQKDDTVTLLNNLHSKHFIVKKIHQILLLLLTPMDFSTIYGRWMNQRFSNTNELLKSFLFFLLKVFPKVENKNINFTIKKILLFFIDNIVKSEKIIVITIPTIAYALCDHSKKVYSILESWDHPGKAPIGYQSNKVFLWNRYLAADWQYYQGQEHVSYCYPIKLDYALKNKILCKSNVILYPAITSSDSEKTLYENEINFLHTLSKVVDNLNIKLFIKPKPNTKIGDLDEFLKYSNVIIGEYQQSGGGSSYSLSVEYNKLRLEEMSQASMVINVGTTFAFDACAVNIPVMQLKFTKVKDFPTFSNLETFPHLNNHLFNKKNLIFELTDNDTIENQLIQILQDPNTIKKAEQFRDYLRDWLIPEESMEESVSRVIDEILKDD